MPVGGDPPEVLETAKHAFDGVAAFVEGRREAVFQRQLALGGMLSIALAASTWRRMASLS
jgi:hypothetical protein